MDKQTKVRIVDDVGSWMASANGVVLTSFERITVEDECRLRKQMREVNGRYKVVRNTLARRALVGDEWSELRQQLVGNTSLSFIDGDVVGALKVLVDFSKANPTFKIKCGVVDGRALSDEEVKRLASLPPRETLIAQLLGVLQSPVRNLVSLLSAPHRNIALVTKAIADKKSGEES